MVICRHTTSCIAYTIIESIDFILETLEKMYMASPLYACIQTSLYNDHYEFV